MKILKKVLHLNYGEEKNQKQVVKSYNFEVATNAEDNTLKEVGEELKNLSIKISILLLLTLKNHYNLGGNTYYGEKLNIYFNTDNKKNLSHHFITSKREFK